MSGTKYDKYFIFETPASPLHPSGSMPWTSIMRIDNRVKQGTFYFECIWLTGTIPESKAFKPHSHDVDEILGFFGSNPADPFNLYGDVEFWFDDEKHVFSRSCVIFVPKGIWHSPIIIPRLERPIFCLSTAPTLNYRQNISSNPKWQHLPDPPEGKWEPDTAT